MPGFILSRNGPSFHNHDSAVALMLSHMSFAPKVPLKNLESLMPSNERCCLKNGAEMERNRQETRSEGASPLKLKRAGDGDRTRDVLLGNMDVVC